MTGAPQGTIPARKCDCGHYARPDEVGTCRICGCTEHRPSRGPYRGHDPQTPPGAEAALQSFSEALEPARDGLVRASDAEVEAELARDAAKRRWLLSDECPKVARDAYTVAYRDAWVADKIVAEERAFRLAQEARKAARVYLDTLAKQMSALQSIAKSVGDSYRGTPR